METLGIIQKKPTFDAQRNKWDYMHLEYDTLEDYCEATSKIMNILYKKNAEGKCLVRDARGNRYDLSIIHANFNTKENRITVLPVSCNEVVHSEYKKPKFKIQ